MYYILDLLALGLSLASSARSAYSAIPRNNPTSQDWASLNKTVGGRLVVGIPWSEPCFSIYNGKPVHPNPEQCAFVQANTFNSHNNRSEFFGTYMRTQWETCMATGDRCELNWRAPTDPAAFSPPAQCKQGSISNYYIDVRNADDVVAAFNFTKKTGVPIVVKNTGHDVPGRGSAPNSLALWTHHIKYISHKPQFIPDDCPPHTPASNALTFGAGQQFSEVYQFADDNGLVVVGGSDQSVGAAGGWVQGGGHSPLSPTLGMGVDRVLQYKVITPDGKFRIVNACQNQDLFFALRGGGGGTFGVVMEASIMASPRQALRVANINWNVSNDNYATFLKVFLDNATTFAEQGWGGYITPTIGNAILISSKVSLSEAQTAMKSLVDVTSSMGKVSNITEIDSYLEWFQRFVMGTAGTQNTIGLPSATSSRLVPQKNHATPEGRAALLNALIESNKQVDFSQIHLTTPFGFSGATNGTSITPAWRDSLWQILLTKIWDYNATLADRKDAYAGVGRAADLFRKITPGSGAYHNEADIHEPNHEESFWGPHYPRLLEIKQKYDPDHLLDCWNCGELTHSLKAAILMQSMSQVGWQGPKAPRFSCYI